LGHLATHQSISLGQKFVHAHRSEKHLMEQVDYNFGGKKEHQYYFHKISVLIDKHTFPQPLCHKKCLGVHANLSKC